MNSSSISKLAPKESGAGLPAVIPEGMRALSVAVNDVVGVAGFVTPGTMVDVLVTGKINDGSRMAKTRSPAQSSKMFEYSPPVRKLSRIAKESRKPFL